MDHFLHFRPTPGILTMDEEHHEILRIVNELKKMSHPDDPPPTTDKPQEQDVWKLRSEGPEEDDDPPYASIKERRRPLYKTLKFPEDDICYHCDEPVSESSLSVFHKTWCEDHLFCAFCNELLSFEFLFLEIDLRPVCGRCYMVAEKGKQKKTSTLERVKSTTSATAVKRSNSLVRSFRKNAKKVHLPGVLQKQDEGPNLAVGEVIEPNSPSDHEFPWREAES